jgi:hypothetical protein
MEKFKVGDKVRWNDPALGDFEPNERVLQSEREYSIIEFLSDEICLISDGFGEAEVFLWELEKIMR